MNPLRQGLKTLLTAILPRERWLVCGPRSASGIALTFDDGPHPEHTPRLLDELNQFDIKATFFVVGQAVARYPDLTRRIANDGHMLGTHTFTHSEPAETSAATMLDETQRTIQLIAGLTGQRPTLFRPPKGKLTLMKSLGLWKLKQTIVLWNQDPRDYLAGSEQGIQPWVNAYVPQRGDIVLLHDTHPHCIRAIRTFADRALDGGLEFSSIDELVGRTREGEAPAEPLGLLGRSTSPAFKELDGGISSDAPKGARETSPEQACEAGAALGERERSVGALKEAREICEHSIAPSGQTPLNSPLTQGGARGTSLPWADFHRPLSGRIR